MGRTKGKKGRESEYIMEERKMSKNIRRVSRTRYDGGARDEYT